MFATRLGVPSWSGLVAIAASVVCLQREAFEAALWCFITGAALAAVLAWVNGLYGRRIAMWGNLLLLAVCAWVVAYPALISVVPRFWGGKSLCGHYPKLEEASIGGGHAHVCPQWYLMTMNFGAIDQRFGASKKRLDRDADADTIGEYGEVEQLFPAYERTKRGAYEAYERRSEGKGDPPLFDVGLVRTSRPDVWTIYEDHFTRPRYYLRLHVPSSVDDAERHFAAIIWPIACQNYTNWTFLVDETGFAASSATRDLTEAH